MGEFAVVLGARERQLNYRYMNNHKYQVFKSAANNEFFYLLRAINGETILNGEGYKSKQSCLDGIASVRVNAKALSVDEAEGLAAVNKPNSGNNFIRMYKGNDDIFGSRFTTNL